LSPPVINRVIHNIHREKPVLKRPGGDNRGRRGAPPGCKTNVATVRWHRSC